MSQVQWLMPVVPATQEVEAGESLELRKWRLQWTEIMPLHCSLGLGDRDRCCLKKREKKSKIKGTIHMAGLRLHGFLLHHFLHISLNAFWLRQRIVNRIIQGMVLSVLMSLSTLRQCGGLCVVSGKIYLFPWLRSWAHFHQALYLFKDCGLFS